MWFTGKQFWAQTFEFRKVYGDTTEPQGLCAIEALKISMPLTRVTSRPVPVIRESQSSGADFPLP